jgi:hypothetical protein
MQVTTANTRHDNSHHRVGRIHHPRVSYILNPNVPSAVHHRRSHWRSFRSRKYPRADERIMPGACLIAQGSVLFLERSLPPGELSRAVLPA